MLTRMLVYLASRSEWKKLNSQDESHFKSADNFFDPPDDRLLANSVELVERMLFEY